MRAQYRFAWRMGRAGDEASWQGSIFDLTTRGASEDAVQEARRMMERWSAAHAQYENQAYQFELSLQDPHTGAMIDIGGETVSPAGAVVEARRPPVRRCWKCGGNGMIHHKASTQTCPACDGNGTLPVAGQ